MSDKKHDGNSENIGSAVSRMAKKHSSRRGFLKKAIITTVAVVGTAKLAEKTVSVITEADHQKEYLGDVLPGDREMASRKYVQMTKAEKKAMVRQFEKDYKSRS